MRRVMRVLPRHGALSVVTTATHALRCTTATLVHNNNNNDADKTHASGAAAAATSTAQHQQQQQLNGEHAKQTTTTTTTTMTQCVKDAYEVTTRCNARGEAVSYTIRSPPSHIAAARVAAAAAAQQPSSSCAAAGAAVASDGTTSSAVHADANNDSGSSATATAATRTSAPHSSTATTTSASAPAVHHAIFSEPIKRIILIRNGLSEADVNVSAFVTTPDWRIPLVEEGRRQCVDTGRALADLVGDEPVYFYYSPYIRARQSLRYVLQGYDERGAQRAHATRSAQQQHDDDDDDDNNDDSSNNSNEDEQQQCASSSLMSSARAPLSLASDTSQLVLRPDTFKRIAGVREDVRLRDADVGRYASTDELLHHMRERERYGLFFYRFPHGESGADVCDRVTGFLDAFQRERLGLPMNVNVVLLTHGLTIRMFVTRWFHLTVDTFHAMQSPPPASMCVLTRLHRQSRFRLDETSFDALRLPASLNACNGYRYRNKQLLGSMSIGAPYM